MPDPNETSPEQAQGQPEAGSADKGASPAAEAAAPASAESQPSADEIARWRALDAKFKEQNVDPETLLPEFTRTRQFAKEAADEAGQWRQLWNERQKAEAARAAQQADPGEAIAQRLVEAQARGDYAEAVTLQRQLWRHDAQNVADQRFGQLSHQERLAQSNQAIREHLVANGVPASEADALAGKLFQNPRLLGDALIRARDPEAFDRRIVESSERKRREADELARRSRSIGGQGGRNPSLGADIEDDPSAPFDIPESLYFGKPESYWRKTLGERFKRVRLTRHDGTPVAG